MSTGIEYRVKVARTVASCCAFSVALTVVTADVVYSIDLWPILPQSGLPVRLVADGTRPQALKQASIIFILGHN
jgi:hypothetical protein